MQTVLDRTLLITMGLDPDQMSRSRLTPLHKLQMEANQLMKSDSYQARLKSAAHSIELLLYKCTPVRISSPNCAPNILSHSRRIEERCPLPQSAAKEMRFLLFPVWTLHTKISTYAACRPQPQMIICWFLSELCTWTCDMSKFFHYLLTNSVQAFFFHRTPYRYLFLSTSFPSNVCT